MASKTFRYLFVLAVIGFVSFVVDGQDSPGFPSNFLFDEQFRSNRTLPKCYHQVDGQVNFNWTSDQHLGRNYSYDSNELKIWPGHLCSRECNDSAPPQICYFEFTLEYWNILGPACRRCQNGFYEDCFNEGCLFADGIERGLLTVNRQMPGPAIHVCKNDIVVIDVKNRMSGNDESIHWHGILQHGTPWMDGVSYVTQCPIHSDNTFRYAFTATKWDTGTNYYHSHTGHHKVNGIFGALVVHDARTSDPNAYTYECDNPNNTILLSDWFHTPAENMVPGLQNTSTIPATYLINGRGPYRNPLTNERTRMPLSVFRVHPNKCRSNRFRFINSDSSICPCVVQIEGHKPEVIAVDSYSVKPFQVDSIFSAAGERIDFYLPAVQPGPQTEYWIVITATGVCQGRNLKTFAILSYANESVSDEELSIPKRPYPDADYPQGIAFNKPNTICGGEDYCPSDVEDAETQFTTDEKMQLMQRDADERVVLAFNTYAISDNEAFHYDVFHSLSNIGRRTFVGAVNNITMTMPHISMDTQPCDIVEKGSIDQQTFCDRDHLPSRCDDFDQCPCTHRLKFKKNSVVDLIMVDDTQQAIPLSHPFHLHGHGFYPMNYYCAPSDQPISAEIVRQAVADGTFDAKFGQLKRLDVDYDNPSKKDTIQVPSKGLVVLRVVFDNPGFWLMHCHIDWHLGIGMAFVIQVGELDDIPPPPKNFPKCRNFEPTIVAMS